MVFIASKMSECFTQRVRKAVLIVRITFIQSLNGWVLRLLRAQRASCSMGIEEQSKEWMVLWLALRLGRRANHFWLICARGLPNTR